MDEEKRKTSNFFQEKNKTPTDVGLYYVDIYVQAENLTIKEQEGLNLIGSD